MIENESKLNTSNSNTNLNSNLIPKEQKENKD
jgi:hypothetical protein